MPCYLFKGLVFAEEAMFLTYYGDLITYFIYHPNDQLFNAITMGFSQLVSLVKACQLSMFPLPDKLKLLGFHVSLFWRKIFRSFLTLHLFLSSCRWTCVCFSFLDSLLGKFPGSIDEEVSRVPVSPSRELQHIFIVALQPVLSLLPDPAHIMTGITGSPLVCQNCLKDIVSTIAAANVILKPPVFIFCSILGLPLFPQGFCLHLALDACACLLHQPIFIFFEQRPPRLDLFLQFSATHVVHVQHHRELHIFQNLGIDSSLTLVLALFEVEPDHLDGDVARQPAHRHCFQ